MKPANILTVLLLALLAITPSVDGAESSLIAKAAPYQILGDSTPKYKSKFLLAIICIRRQNLVLN